jgi:hypothetical protein
MSVHLIFPNKPLPSLNSKLDNQPFAEVSPSNFSDEWSVSTKISSF